MPERPRVVVVAGPNGSGKTTITAGLDLVGVYVNADEIARSGGLGSLDAAREAELIREHCLARKLDFTFETVLSTDRNLALLRRAKEAGYRVEAVFVLTSTPELGIFRIAGRELGGGHSVPPEKVRSRFPKSLGNLPELVRLSDVCTVFDNTGSQPLVIYRKDPQHDAVVAAPGWTAAAVRRLVSGGEG